MTTPDSFSPKRLARIAAMLNLFGAVATGVSVSAISKVFVSGNAPATAANILTAETMFRSGMVTELFGLAAFLTSMIMLYRLLKPASVLGASLVLAFSLACSTIQALDVLGDIGGLVFLKRGAGVAAVALPEAQALAFAGLLMHSYVYTIALFFCGFASLAIAYTVRQATFVPRLLGLLIIIDGLGFLIFTSARLAAPSFSVHLQPFVPYVTAAIGEAPLWFWLLFKGVDEQRWREQQEAAIQRLDV